MTIKIGSLNAELIYDYLDRSEGETKVGDNRLDAKAWNKFIDTTGIKGSKISYSIFKNRTKGSYGAVDSLSLYLKKSDEITKQKIVDYLNALEKEYKALRNNSSTKKQIPTKNNKAGIKLHDSDFGKRTHALNKLNVKHKTTLLDVAQDSLGIKEVSRKEFEQLSDKDKEKTQYAMIGNYGDITDQWCAHTVSTLCSKAGVKIGPHKKSVQQFINWGTNNNTYHPITCTTMNSANINDERKSRYTQIKKQLKNIHEGDFIIMKSQYIARTANAGNVSQKASHIMIVESTDLKKGTITVIEGNANENIYQNAKRLLVQNETEGTNGEQEIGEFQEVNRRDGLIRKKYSLYELISYGYSGYIDNSTLV